MYGRWRSGEVRLEGGGKKWKGREGRGGCACAAMCTIEAVGQGLAAGDMEGREKRRERLSGAYGGVPSAMRARSSYDISVVGGTLTRPARLMAYTTISIHVSTG